MKLTTTLKKGEKSQVTITGELAWDDFTTFRGIAIKQLAERVDIDGFRKGTAPENIIVAKLGDMKILEEMSQCALAKIYPELLTEHSVDAIGYPDIAITKIASGSPLGFTITTATMPVVTLADYKKIAKKIMDTDEDIAVTDKEVNDALLQLRKMRYHSKLSKESETPETVPEIKDIADKDVPELSLEDIKQFGNFTDLEDFTAKLKSNLEHEKLHQNLDKKRAEIIETIIKESTIEAPQILVDYEIDRMIAQMKHDLSMSGLSFDDYLKHVNKTLTDMRNDYQSDAEKRAYMQLIVNNIAEAEKLKVNKEKADKELAHIEKVYKDHKDFDMNRAEEYVHSVLLNQAVFEFLESQGKNPVHVHEEEK